MTACCCRLTHPPKTRTRKASGGGSESMAPSVRREVGAVKAPQILDSDAVNVGRLPGPQASHSCLEHADYPAVAGQFDRPTPRVGASFDDSAYASRRGRFERVTSAFAYCLFS